MTISQLKEHSLRDHGEALTLPRLRAGATTQGPQTRPLRLGSDPHQTPLTSNLDGKSSICITKQTEMEDFY